MPPTGLKIGHRPYRLAIAPEGRYSNPGNQESSLCMGVLPSPPRSRTLVLPWAPVPARGVLLGLVGLGQSLLGAGTPFWLCGEVRAR